MAFYAKLIRKQKLQTICFGVSFKLFQSIGLLIIFSYELIKQPMFFGKLKRTTIFLKPATFGPRAIGWRPLVYSFMKFQVFTIYTQEECRGSVRVLTLNCILFSMCTYTQLYIVQHVYLHSIIYCSACVLTLNYILFSMCTYTQLYIVQHVYLHSIIYCSARVLTLNYILFSMCTYIQLYIVQHVYLHSIIYCSARVLTLNYILLSMCTYT